MNDMDSFLDGFYTPSGDYITITAEQASRFAKDIAGDFNPIHDPDAKRFCVPGDLLLALVLERYGLAEKMSFSFENMVGAETPLRFPERPGETITIDDPGGKAYLHVRRSGAVTHDPALIEALTRRYVAFSGHNFPHVLQPLLEEKGVMFNPDRPLVIYDSMGFELDGLDFGPPDMEMVDAFMEVDGKRGNVMLRFRFTAGGRTVGAGSKKLLVSGLREYDGKRMEEIVTEFYRRKTAYADGERVSL